MLANLKGYEPKDVQYILSDNVKDIFPAELDFNGKEIGKKKVKTAADAMKLIGKDFSATFPTGEMVERSLDDFEVSNIREEYCVMCENDLPERERHLEEVLEQIKSMKKKAEEELAGCRMNIAKLTAQVKNGTADVTLKNGETFCIALAGYYVYYTYDRNKNKFVLAKAYEVTDRTELWSQEDTNRKAMLELFGLEFPEPEKPEESATEANADDGKDDDGNDLPFENENE